MTVSVDNVATELARPTPDPLVADQWQSWIDRAYRMIRAEFGESAYAALDPDLVDDVVLMAVVEHVRSWRESTASQYTVSVDDGTVSRRFEASSGPLSIADDLWALLGVNRFGQSFSIGPA